jgi:hypothetical protein
MKKAIILNAPPGAGKDTIGNLLCKHAPRYVVKRSFKEPMFKIAKAMLGDYRFSLFMQAYDDRERKEKAQSFLNGKSPRQFMIWISEDVIKPQFGDQYFGMIMAEAIRDSQVPVIITDGGFPEEVKPLVSAGIEVHICRLHRDGYTFDGDSRNYLNLDGYHHRIVTHDYELVSGNPMATVDQICEEILG